MKVTAFSSIAVAGVETTSTRAPSAGPATIAAWPTAARRALARWSSGPGTSRAVLTATHGGTAVPAAVAAAAITGARTIGSPAAATAASATMSAARTRSAPIINLRRSCRSAMTPPSGPRKTMGSTRRGRGQRDPRPGVRPFEHERQQGHVVEPVAARGDRQLRQGEAETGARRGGRRRESERERSMRAACV